MIRQTDKLPFIGKSAMLRFIRVLTVSCLFSLPCLAFDSLDSLTIEEKVGQLLMVHFNGEVANADAKTLIQDTKVGAIIYYNWANGLHSPKQVQTLSYGLQELAHANPNPIPLLIATDQEGGVVTRLQKGFTIFPGNKALGETQDPQLAEECARAMGYELRAVGINMNLAPVVDINSNPRNPIIGIRSFGEDPETVTLFGEKALKGYRDAEVIATLKHFPGYGEVEVDPHEDLPIIRKTREELEKVELVPFTKLATSCDAIMTAHIQIPTLDPEYCSTLSEKTLTYLRETIGFQGVIVADSLVMEGVVKKCHTVDEASIQALKAGCDILILGGKLLHSEHNGFELHVQDVQRIHKAIVDAIKCGRISETRLNQATQRVLNLKKKYLYSQLTLEQIEKTVNTVSHRLLAKKIASCALKNVRNSHLNLDKKRLAIIAPRILSDSIHEPFIAGKTTTTSFFFETLSPPHSDIENALEKTKRTDVLIVFSYNAWRNPSQITLIRKLIDTGKPVILVATRDPIDTSLFPEVSLIFKTFSPTQPSLQAVADYLNIGNPH